MYTIINSMHYLKILGPFLTKENNVMNLHIDILAFITKSFSSNYVLYV